MADDDALDGWDVVIDGGPDERIDFDDLATLSEVTHPLRGRLLGCFRHPGTVAEAAEKLDVPITRLYHHMKRLEAAGLLRVVATRRVGSTTERRYEVAAHNFGPSAELLESSNPTEMAAALGALFDFAKLGMQRELELHGRSAHDDDRSMLALMRVPVTETGRADLIRRLNAVVEEFRSETDVDDPDRELFSVFVAAFPSQ